MPRLSLAELERECDAWDLAVEGDPEIDPFCSRAAWGLSHHAAFGAEREAIAVLDGARGVALAIARSPGVGAVLEPLEAMWGFGSPLVGASAAELLRDLLARDGALPGVLALSGIPARGPRLDELASALAPTHRLRAGLPVERYCASLSGGIDGFLARRSRKFRQGLRDARRRAREAGIEFAHAARPSRAEVDAFYSRALALEANTWKTASGNGVASGGMRAFYASLLPRLAERGALRILEATQNGVAVGYLHGGLVGGRFRGLQFAFDERLRSVGLGNVLQLEMLERLCQEGATRYDLGSQSSYKARWAEVELVTCTVVARLRG